MTSTETGFLVLGLKDAPGPHIVRQEGLVAVVLEESGSIPITWEYSKGLTLLSEHSLPGRKMPGAPSAHAFLIGAGEPEQTQLVFIKNNDPKDTLVFDIHVV